LGCAMTTRRTGQVLCPVLIGRDAEAAVVAEKLERTLNGNGGMVFLVGEPGIGKTRLAREAQDRARVMGLRTIRGRSAAGAGPIPFRPIAEAIQSGIRVHGVPDDPALEPYRPALRGLIPGWSSTPATDPAPLLLFEGVRLLLHALAGDESLVVLLEDIHWADADTLAVLDHLADGLAEEPVLVLATLRDERGPAADLAEGAAARRAATRIVLGRLTPEHTAEMARRSLEMEAIPDTLLETLVDRAEGVPFVVEEMLTAYVAAGSPETLPPTYRELVRSRMATLGDEAKQVLNAAATVGRRFDWQLLTAITDLPRDRLLDELRAAVDSKLVVAGAGGALTPGFGFRHSLVRDSILADLLPPERADLAGRAADVIEAMHPGLPGEWCERVADLREVAGDRTAAARHLQEAAARALHRGALGSSEAMLERARTLAAGDRWHLVGIDRALAEVLSLSGKTARLEEIGAAAVAFVSEKRGAMPFITLSLGDLHLRLARGFATAGNDERSNEHLALAETFARQVGEKALLARLNAFAAQRKLVLGELASAHRAAVDALTAARDLNLADVASEALRVQGVVAFLEGDARRSRETLERAVEEAGDAPVARLAALIELGALDASTTGSLDVLRATRERAERSGAVSALARIDLLIGSSLVDRFKLVEAARALRSCIDTARRYGLAILSAASAVEAQRAALAGSKEAARSAPGESGEASLSRAVIALLDEDRARALAEVEGALDPTAQAVGRLLGSPGSTAPGGSALVRGLAAFAVLIAGDAAPGGSSFHEADQLLEPFPWWRQVARRLIAEAAIDQGLGDPAAWLREGLAFFEEAGHERIASACRALMRRSGAPVPRKGRGDAAVPPHMRARGVTSREMDVLKLLGEGLGNREIGERLFLSARTIETHVASLMRKLDAGSRAELRQAAAGSSTAL
jgi:DNA-binding CsgD family transcriptional regulator